jgi:hypothetical protein
MHCQTICMHVTVLTVVTVFFIIKELNFSTAIEISGLHGDPGHAVA